MSKLMIEADATVRQALDEHVRQHPEAAKHDIHTVLVEDPIGDRSYPMSTERISTDHWAELGRILGDQALGSSVTPTDLDPKLAVPMPPQPAIDDPNDPLHGDWERIRELNGAIDDLAKQFVFRAPALIAGYRALVAEYERKATELKATIKVPGIEALRPDLPPHLQFERIPDQE